MIKFDVTPEQKVLIDKIALRAESEVFQPYQIEQTQPDTIMDLSATVAQGCRLDLAGLLAASAFDFAHDLCGIRRHINRSTGFLENCFLPRFARS